MGWTMGCGTVRIIADQLSGRNPAINVASRAYQR